jgi:hypothetical protein
VFRVNDEADAAGESKSDKKENGTLEHVNPLNGAARCPYGLRQFEAPPLPMTVATIFTLFAMRKAKTEAIANQTKSDSLALVDPQDVDKVQRLNDCVIRLPDGAARSACALSALTAAELVLGHASPQPPADDPQRPPACFVRERSSNAVEKPFWHAKAAER